MTENTNNVLSSSNSISKIKAILWILIMDFKLKMCFNSGHIQCKNNVNLQVYVDTFHLKIPTCLKEIFKTSPGIIASLGRV